VTTALERVEAYRATAVARRQQPAGRRGFTQPPFWSMDHLWAPYQSSLPDREQIEHSFEGYARGAGKGDGVVFACFYARLRHYAQATFRWENLTTRELSDSPALEKLARPWPTGTTSDLLAWMEVDATFAGNSYWTWTDDAGRFGRLAVGPGRRLTRMRPDWVRIVLSSASGDPYALDAKIVAFAYEPRVSAVGVGAPQDRMVILTPAEVAHYAPVPDPEARFRGMSWLSPVIREVSADRAAMEHKLQFFQRGATLSTIVALDKDISVETFTEFVDRFRAEHQGANNAFGTLFVGGGADVTPVTADLSQLDYKGVTGSGETRIAAAAGVHPVIVGLSEGLAGSSLNAGNYKSARRNFADGTLTHLWTATASSLQNLFRPPGNSRLWIDKTQIPFLAEDAADVATIQQTQANALRSLVDAGFAPDAAVEFLRSNDLGRLLENHSGLFSVQLQPPGSAEPAANGNGSANGAAPEGTDVMKQLLALTRGGS
jgi:hypothetical protein